LKPTELHDETITVDGGLNVSMKPLHPAGFKNGMAAAHLEQSVHSVHTLLGDERFVPSVAGPLQRAENFTFSSLQEHL
jgi:hypothetical protein